MSTQEFQSLTNVIRTAGQKLLDRSQTGAVFLPLDDTNYVAVGTLAGIKYAAGKEFSEESSTAGAAKGGVTRLEGLTRYGWTEDTTLGMVDLRQRADGAYVKLADVERLLASTAVEQKEPEQAAVSAITDEMVDAAIEAFNDFPCPMNGSIARSWNRDHMRAALEGAMRTASQAAPAAPERLQAVSVPRSTLLMIYEAMNHMGDILNGMDACEDDDEEATTPAFDAIRALLDDSPFAATSAAAPAAPEQEQWISVEVQLPAIGQEVLIWCGYRICGYRSDDKHDPENHEGWVIDFANGNAKAITHWMPMPAAPSMKRQAISEGEKGGKS